MNLLKTQIAFVCLVTLAKNPTFHKRGRVLNKAVHFTKPLFWSCKTPFFAKHKNRDLAKKRTDAGNVFFSKLAASSLFKILLALSQPRVWGRALGRNMFCSCLVQILGNQQQRKSTTNWRRTPILLIALLSAPPISQRCKFAVVREAPQTQCGPSIIPTAYYMYVCMYVCMYECM